MLERSPNSTVSTSDNEQSKELTLSLVQTISKVLKNIILSQELSSSSAEKINLFCLESVPSISISDYLSRIVSYTNIETSTLISSLIYIDRLCSNTNIKLSFYNIYSIISIALYLSIKFNEDTLCKEDFYAKVAGLSMGEIAKTSLVFMKIIDYKLYISIDEYKIYEQYILKDFFANYFCLTCHDRRM